MFIKISMLLLIAWLVQGCGRLLDVERHEDRLHIPDIEEGIYSSEGGGCPLRVRRIEPKISLEKTSTSWYDCAYSGQATVYTKTSSGVYLSDGVSGQSRLLINVTSSNSFVVQDTSQDTLNLTGVAFHRIGPSN